jgi:hypothetical protein
VREELGVGQNSEETAGNEEEPRKGKFTHYEVSND